ncbi:hypothetical protein MYOV003v1_p0195 [Vibrio phage 207E48.1]|nr:hypothetical protein MYOV003v1_p0195 [Vibrio phage 207E48.1]
MSLNVLDKSPVLDLARKIRSRYIEQQGIPAEQQDMVMEPFLKDGDAILPLSSVVVIVTRQPSPTDASDAIKVAVSANIISSPEGIAIEVGFVCREFNADLAEVFCMDPTDGTIAEGTEAAWELFHKLRRREMLNVMNEMVGQRKAQQDAEGRMQGAGGLVDSNGNELGGDKQIVTQQNIAESGVQI